jgi:hypothetical protein
MTSFSVMNAITLILDEHLGQTSGSTPYTRAIMRAQLPERRLGRGGGGGAGAPPSSSKGWTGGVRRHVEDAAP